MEGISALLSSNTNFDVVALASRKEQLLDLLRQKTVHILVVNIHTLDTLVLNLIVQLNISFPKVKILVMSHNDSEDMVLKTIKAGAKGYLASEADYNELVEALLTLRNGYDYYSKSITHLLVNKYITYLKSDNDQQRTDIGSLSSRQVEILRLWGNNLTNKEISEKLFISIRTVETHKNHIMQKLNLKTTVDMVKFGIRNNLIEI